MDTPPSFFREAAGLATPDFIRENSFDVSQAIGMPQYSLQPSPIGIAPPEVPEYGLNGVQDVTPSTGRPGLKAKARTSISSTATASKPSTRTNSQSSEQTRKSVSSRSTAPADEPQPPKRRKGKKAVKIEPPDDTNAVADGSEQDEKRSKFLERNRVAASKCRQRKKQWVTDLQESKNALETQNSQLHMERSRLLNELSEIKNQLMGHGNCNHPSINLWIENEARRFVESEAGRISISQVMKGNTMANGPVPNSLQMRSSVDGPSPEMSPIAMDPSLSRVTPRTESSTEINYDHMPDTMFESSEAPVG